MLHRRQLQLLCCCVSFLVKVPRNSKKVFFSSCSTSKVIRDGILSCSFFNFPPSSMPASSCSNNNPRFSFLPHLMLSLFLSHELLSCAYIGHITEKKCSSPNNAFPFLICLEDARVYNRQTHTHISFFHIYTYICACIHTAREYTHTQKKKKKKLERHCQDVSQL